jgi:hypothetical protein
VAPAQDVVTSQPAATLSAADRSDAQRLLSTARMWGDKHRDDLARDALRKGLLIAPDDPGLLAEQMRVLLRLGDSGAQAALAPAGAHRRRRTRAARPTNTASRRAAAARWRRFACSPAAAARTKPRAASSRCFRTARPGALGAEYYEILANAPGGREARSPRCVGGSRPIRRTSTRRWRSRGC